MRRCIRGKPPFLPSPSLSRLAIDLCLCSSERTNIKPGLQNLFTFRGGDVVGILLYALLATLCIASGMTISSLAGERASSRDPPLDQGGSAAATHSSSSSPYSGIVFSAFGSLLVGWAWQTFFVTLFGHVIPNRQDETGLAVMASIIVAAIVLLCAVRVELVLHRRKLRRHAKRQAQAQSQLSQT